MDIRKRIIAKEKFHTRNKLKIRIYSYSLENRYAHIHGAVYIDVGNALGWKQVSWWPDTGKAVECDPNWDLIAEAETIKDMPRGRF